MSQDWPEGALFHSPLGLFGFQEESIVRDYLKTEDGGGMLVVWDTGCIYGDAEVVVNRGGLSRRRTLRDLVQKFNGGNPRGGRSWDLSIPTYVQREAEDGTIRLARLVNAWESGVKQTYTVTTDTGRTIRATDEHPFLTERGWLRLDQLVVGDLVHVRGEQASGKARKKKNYYKQVSWLVAHPYATQRRIARSPHRVTTHRLTAEADLNGMSLEAFIQRIRSGNVVGLQFLDPNEIAVHHKDHDHRNNDLSNLQVMTHAEHHRLHADEGKTASVLYKATTESVVSVEPHGMEETFDLEVADEPHNFLANGFVVHNTGKSIFGLRMATLLAEDARNGVREHDLTVVLCEKGKVGEWVEDFSKFTRLSVRKHHGGNRMKLLERDGLPDVLVTTYETAKADLVRFTRPAKGKRGTKITPGPLFEAIADKHVLWLGDEFAAKLGRRTSDAYKAFDWVWRQRRKSHPQSHRIFALTATPIETGYENAFNQGRLLAPERMPTVAEFEEWMVRSRHPVYGTPTYRAENAAAFAELLAPIIDRRRKTDPDIMAQFPKKVERVATVEMEREQARLYDMVATLQQPDEEPVPGLWTVLRMIADHPAALVEAAAKGEGKIAKMLVEELGADFLRSVGSAKEKELLVRLEHAVKEEHSKVVVFTFFGQTVLPVLAKAIRAKGIKVYENHGALSEHEAHQRRQFFKADSDPCVFLTSDAGCRGINLPEATQVIEFEGSLTYANHVQRIDRIHRISSDSPSVMCTTLVADDTIEVAILKKVLQRNEQSDVLLGDDDAGEDFWSAQERRAAFGVTRMRQRTHKARRESLTGS